MGYDWLEVEWFDDETAVGVGGGVRAQEPTSRRDIDGGRRRAGHRRQPLGRLLARHQRAHQRAGPLPVVQGRRSVRHRRLSRLRRPVKGPRHTHTHTAKNARNDEERFKKATSLFNNPSNNLPWTWTHQRRRHGRDTQRRRTGPGRVSRSTPHSRAAMVLDIAMYN